MSGLGPGRSELRAGGVASLKPFLLPLSLLFVFVLTVAIAGVRSLLQEAGARKGLLWGALFLLPLVAVVALSCFVLRTDARHEKENYRGAAATALEAVKVGKRVWWLADACGAEYYRLPLAKGDESEAARWIVNAVELPQPRLDVVVYSRADVYDNQGTVTRILKEEGYRATRELQGFVVWEL